MHHDIRQIYLNVGKIHSVEVREHLVDLGGVLEDGASCLGQVVQTGVTSQRLGKGTDHRHLHHGDRTRVFMSYSDIISPNYVRITYNQFGLPTHSVIE